MINFKEEITNDKQRLLNVKDDLQHLSVSEIRQKADSNIRPFSICLLNLTGDLNIGVCVRTACMLGATTVYILGRRRFDKRSTTGSDKYITVVKEFALNKDMDIDKNIFNQTMKKHNMVPVFIEHGGTPLSKVHWREDIFNYQMKADSAFSYYSTDNAYHPCLVFGNEGRGIPSYLYSDNDKIISIEQPGILRSYNVSAAMSIVTYEICKEMYWL